MFQTHTSEDGLVRSVRIVIADPTLDGKGRRTRPVSELDRPVQKLVLLLTQDSTEGDHEIPVEEPSISADEDADK